MNQPKRRTQAQRREATQSTLLTTATELFGSRGYADTSMEDVAEACGMTIRPIYHYFGSKLALFQAVVEGLENKVIEEMEFLPAGKTAAAPYDIWERFIKRCEDPHFRQIIMIDSPNILGWQRWSQGPIPQSSRKRISEIIGREADDLSVHMLMGALQHAAFHIADKEASDRDYEQIRKMIEYFSKERDQNIK